MKRVYLLLIALALALGAASCNVNDYCLNCAKGGGDGGGSGGDGGDNGDGGMTSDAIDAGCVPTGPEVCDGIDNDCNGFVDDGTLPEVGAPCDNQVGACHGSVKVCDNGHLKCTYTPTPEICDNVDNDCNGLTDEGDPGGGSHCGTDVGECVAGTNHCVAGHITCTGFQDHTGDSESCDLKDNDCDGSFDEGLTNMGACGIKTCIGGTTKGKVCQTSADCGGGGACTASVGVCMQGTLSCDGGSPTCHNFGTPSFEICDLKDNDCDGSVDEDFHKDTDVLNCHDCGHVCPVPANAVPTCTAGACGYTCQAGWVDLDGLSANGCEYHCFKSGVEVCDGEDNDCDGLVDAMDPDLGAAPAICSTIGECAVGSSVTCDGASGWVCHYGSTVSTDGMGNIIPETQCDGLDNDCNNIIDDHQPNLNQACADAMKGECQSTGTFQCDPMNLTGPAICNYTHLGATAVAESCNNKDDDCDGVIDNVTTLGTFPNTTESGLDWINIGGGHQMMKYEASKPDATSGDQGSVNTSCGAVATITGITESGTTATVTTAVPHNLPVGRVVAISGENVAGYNTSFVVATVPTATTFTITAASGLGTATGGTAAPQCPTCSVAGVQPWTNVSYPQAVAACAAVGATLCSETQWHRACSVVASVTWPVTLSGNKFLEAEDYAGIGFKQDARPEAGASCNNATDQDGDGFINDGCPASGTAESGAQCLNNTDDDGDGLVNDGCPTMGTMRSWSETYINGWSGIGSMISGPNTTVTIPIANAVAESPRLDYAVTIGATSTLHVFVRMWGATANDNQIFLGLTNATPPQTPTITMTMPNGTTGGAWVWVDSGAITVPAAGVRTISVFMAKDGVAVDALYVATDGTSPPATAPNGPGNTWAYASTPNTYQATTCNGHDYDATTDATLTTGFLASCYANDNALTSGTTDNGYDMSGNVKEWTLAHQPGQNPIRGGASDNTDIGTSCALNFTLAGDTFFFPNVGFRCCR